MSLFEITGTNGLTPYRLLSGSELYEQEVEDVFWENPESFLGEGVFRLGRQVCLPMSGVADVVLIDRDGRVIVVEIKRDIDRTQLAQCLEYAGWARSTNLDELAGLYPAGAEAFFDDWRTFTDSVAPRLITGSPRVVLVARGFSGRTQGALEFLAESGVPVTWVPIAIYQDETGRRLIDIEGDFEPLRETDKPLSLEIRARQEVMVNGRRVTIADLIEAGFIEAGATLYWDRPRVGQQLRAVVEPNGSLRLPDDRAFASPSTAAAEAAGAGSFDGWEAWRVGSPTGRLLKEIREEYVETAESTVSE